MVKPWMRHTATTHPASCAENSLAQIWHRFVTEEMARLEGFEPPTNGFGSHYSIRLSYRRVSRDGGRRGRAFCHDCPGTCRC